jgi:hypothetical protein
MAEILIRMGATHADPCAWQRFYPVAVFEDGHKYGSAETWPVFAILRITNATVAEVRQYLDPDLDTTDPQHPITRALRKWKIALDDAAVPQWIKTAVQAGEVVSVTKAQIANFIKRTLV